MKKFLFILYISCIFSLFLFGDAASLKFAPGGNVKSFNNDSIKMKDEQITIKLKKGYYEVSVNYTFVNTSKKQNVLMGFPNSYNFIEGEEGKTFKYAINDFKAFIGDKALNVNRKNIASDDVQSSGSLFETFEVEFGKGETKIITNTYTQKYFSEYGSTIARAEYILKTGASWKDKIDKIDVKIINEIPTENLENRTVYFLEAWDDNFDYSKSDYKLEVSPNDYILEKNIIKMSFENIEPDFDLKITLPPAKIGTIFGSSELDEDKNDKYAAKNLIDNNPDTSWVEGKPDSGINEYIKLYIPPIDEVLSAAYKISKIGIINGYAKNDDLFFKNNRVKRVRVEYKNDTYSDNNPYGMKKEKPYEFILKDTREMQYLTFGEAVFMSEMKITILDVYKGSKWDDTCIAELDVFF